MLPFGQAYPSPPWGPFARLAFTTYSLTRGAGGSLASAAGAAARSPPLQVGRRDGAQTPPFAEEEAVGTGADAATRGRSPQAYLCARAAGALGQPLPRPGGCGRCLGGGAPARAALGLRADALPRSAAARGGGAGDSSAPRPPELSDPAGARAERLVAGSTLSACAPGLAQVRGVCPGPRGPPGPTGVRTGRGAWRGGCCGPGVNATETPGGGAASEPAWPPGPTRPSASSRGQGGEEE